MKYCTFHASSLYKSGSRLLCKQHGRFQKREATSSSFFSTFHRTSHSKTKTTTGTTKWTFFNTMRLYEHNPCKKPSGGEDATNIGSSAWCGLLTIILPQPQQSPSSVPSRIEMSSLFPARLAYANQAKLSSRWCPWVCDRKPLETELSYNTSQRKVDPDHTAERQTAPSRHCLAPSLNKTGLSGDERRDVLPLGRIVEATFEDEVSLAWFCSARKCLKNSVSPFAIKHLSESAFL